MRDAANLYRRLVFAAVILVCIAPIQGETAHAIGALATFSSLILYLLQGLGTLRLNLAWHVGYLTIISNEGLKNGDSIRAAVDASAFDEASRYITAANAAVLLVRALAFDDREKPIVDVRPEHPSDNSRLLLFVLVVYFFFMFWELPQAISFTQTGRNVEDVDIGRTAITTIMEGLATSAGVILPSLVIYYARFTKKLSANIGLALSIPPLFVFYIVGIRFLVLMAAAGAFVLYVPVIKNKIVPFWRFGFLGAILYVSASSMAVFRTEGFKNTTWTSVEEYYENNLGMHVEGVVATLTKMVDHYRHHDHLLGRSSGTLLVFWIPREFWPEKPTFIDYWFIREYQGEQGFSNGYSTGSTFASDAFVDFGFIGGVVFSGIFFGLLLSILDRTVAHLLVRRGHPYTVVIAPLFGGALFAVRSFNTTVIQMSGVLVIGTMFALLCDRAVDRPVESSES